MKENFSPQKEKWTSAEKTKILLKCLVFVSAASLFLEKDNKNYSADDLIISNQIKKDKPSETNVAPSVDMLGTRQSIDNLFYDTTDTRNVQEDNQNNKLIENINIDQQPPKGPYMDSANIDIQNKLHEVIYSKNKTPDTGGDKEKNIKEEGRAVLTEMISVLKNENAFARSFKNNINENKEEIINALAEIEKHETSFSNYWPIFASEHGLMNGGKTGKVQKNLATLTYILYKNETLEKISDFGFVGNTLANVMGYKNPHKQIESEVKKFKKNKKEFETKRNEWSLALGKNLTTEEVLDIFILRATLEKTRGLSYELYVFLRGDRPDPDQIEYKNNVMGLIKRKLAENEGFYNATKELIKSFSE